MRVLYLLRKLFNFAPFYFILMKRFRPYLFGAAVIVAALLAYGLFTLPRHKDALSEGFSAERAARDIEVISREHHSVAHPAERSKVREYLISRLEELGADTVMTYQYDSLIGPLNKHVCYTFDAVDVLAQFSPEGVDNPTYMMFVAHYDSRYSQIMPKDTVWSYGAADDGYGVSTALECTARLLDIRPQWNQGVKVLFTDAEEAGMDGMYSIWEKNPEVFENVGFIVNVEGRGTWGPALLFETSKGNSKVMELYRQAKYPYTYSLTTVVYGFMPNFTDFTVVKDHIPGMNFSSIADVNHYHTDLDNYSNINLNTIQHYGEQILPVVTAYVTDSKYADKDYLRSEEDTVNFTVPAIGLINMSKTTYLIINIVAFVLLLLLFAFDVIRARVKPAKVFKVSAIALASALVALAVGELFAWVCALVSGAKFKLFGIVAGVMFDNVAMVCFTLITAAVWVLFYILGRKKIVRNVVSMRTSAIPNAISKYAHSVMYGVLMLMFLLSAVLLFAIGENLFFFIPMLLATLAILLWRVTSVKSWFPVATLVILLHAFSFLFALAMALTIGAYGAVLMIASLDLMLIIPMADIYTTK